MKYGFNDEVPTTASETAPQQSAKTIQLGSVKRQEEAPRAAVRELSAVAEVGKAAGFVSRQASAPHRKPGPKRTEPQGKLTLTGPQRVLDRLQAYCDDMGGVPYWKALEELLDKKRR